MGSLLLAGPHRCLQKPHSAAHEDRGLGSAHRTLAQRNLKTNSSVGRLASGIENQLEILRTDNLIVDADVRSCRKARVMPPDGRRICIAFTCWTRSTENTAGKLERFMNDFLRALRSLRGQIFRFCSRCRNGGNPPFFEDWSPRKRLEPLNHTEMRAFLRAFAKTTSPMLLL